MKRQLVSVQNSVDIEEMVIAKNFNEGRLPKTLVCKYSQFSVYISTSAEILSTEASLKFVAKEEFG